MHGHQILEVPLQERQKNGNTYKEVLAYLNDGKVYQSNPSENLPQAAQKGSVCWYYAFNRIRTRYGRAYRDNANRHIEKIISEYRKSLTRFELIREATKFAIADAPTILGIPVEEIKFGELHACFLIANKSRSKIDLSFYDQLESFFKTYFSKITDQNQKNESLVKPFFDILTKDLPEEFKNKLTQEKEEPSFFDTLIYYHKFFHDKFDSNNLTLKTIQVRFAMFLLFITDWLVKLTGKKFDKLSADETVNYIYQKNILMALHELYQNLALKVDEAALVKTLTTAVYNSSMIAIAKQQASQIAKALNNRLMLDIFPTITLDQTVALHNLYELGQAHAFAKIVALYDLQISDWTPKKGFQGLLEAINKMGALVISGKIGKPVFTTSAEQLQEEKQPAKLGSRGILFWPNKADMLPADDLSEGHAIIVLGAQSITNTNQETDEYVFFLDPNDASIPHQERTMYRMDYKDFVKRVYMLSGIQITDSQQCPDDACYAIAARPR